MVSGLSRLAEVEDLKCSHCGEKVSAPKYFDTRGQFYCDPDCWEGKANGRDRRLGADFPNTG